MDATSIVVPSTTPGHMASVSYTNGHSSPDSVDVAVPTAPSPRSESDLSDTKEPIANGASSDEDAPGEEYDGDVPMADDTDSSEDVDAEGEPDGDYDSETPPPEQAPRSRARSSTSQESQHGAKRKASNDDDFSRHPELYGLRRSERPRPTRRIVDSSDEDEDSASDVPRKRRRTTSRKTSNQPTPVYRSASSASDSDGYVGARRNIPTKKEKQRRRLVAEGQEPPSHAEVRFSARRSRQVTNYNEDEEEEDPFAADEDDLPPNYWATAVEDTGPAIDKILDHRPKSDIELDPWYAEKKDFEYQVKWQDKAHYHSTWEQYDTIASCKGFRKVDNYFKNAIFIDMRRLARKKDEPEEFEQHMVAREQEREALLNYHIVERVINSRDGEEGTEYFVKWKGLTYDLSTWETDTLVSDIAQNEIDRFLDRATNRPVSDLKESNMQTRRKFKPLEEQPDYIKYGQLRSFQLQGLNFLAHNWCKGQNVILADEMGLGKTVQTVSFMNWLRHDRRQQGPFLCVVPLSTMPAWADTFNNWTPDVNYVIYTGREDARKIIRECELLVDGNVRKTKFNVLMTTYEYVLADAGFLSQIKWQFLAVDEAHRLKNRDSQLYDKLVNFSSPSRLLITGTPIQNTLGELSALMDFLMPGNKIVKDEDVDLASEDASHKLAELSEAIQPYMIRRTKEKVENDLPPKSEKILRVELSETQLEYYKHILTRNYEALNEGGTGQKQSLLNIVMELKKASNHALLFPNAEAKFVKADATKDETLKALITTSGKMMLLDRLLTKLKADGHRVLIFSQMVHMLDILTDYMRLRNYTYQRLDGTVPASDRKIAIDHFNAPGSDDYCFLLSTRAGGLGINLMTADTVVLFDSDWNPQADLQAMARAHRIGQTKPVSVYRLVSKDTIEEEILERARNKRMLEFITIQRGVTDRQQKEINDKLNRAATEPNSADDINNILKRRGQKMFEQSGNQKKLEDLDIDAVLENAEEHKTEQAAGLTSDGGAEFLKNFEYTDVKIDLEWDDIIPKEELEVVKAEIQQRKDDEQTEKLLAESAPRKRKAAANSEREQRAAKKRAREATKRIDHDSDSDEDDDEADADAPKSDPKRALNTKETRNLIKAYERFGSLDERGPEMLRLARLAGRDMSVIKATLDEIVATSDEHMKKELARLDKLQAEANRQITKKDKKAVLFDFRNVKKINAETIMDRPREMRVLQQAVNAVADFKQFRVPDALKPATYSCPWGAKEDGMLMVGIHRHGYGAWPNIRDDADLGLQDKFYLEEHRVDKKEERNKGDEKNAKSPGAVHLVRRANYLLTVLKDKIAADPEAKRRMENHHRNNKKHQLKTAHRVSEKTSSAAASPGPAGQARKVATRESEKSSHRPHSNGDNRHSERPESRHHDKGTPDHRHRQSDQYRPSESRRKEHRADRDSVDRRPPPSDRKASGDVEKSRLKEERPRPKEERPRPQEERHNSHSQARGPSAERADSTPKKAEKKPDEFLERKLSNMQPNLKRLKKCLPKNYPRDTMVKVLRCELLAIGNFISHIARENSQTPDLESRLWDYTVSHYWPKPNTSVDMVKTMYSKTLTAERAQSNGQANGA